MILLLDLDGTTSDDDWRLPLITSDGYEFYHGQLRRDKPVREILNVMNGLHFSGWMIYAVTARPEKYRTDTMRWLFDIRAPIERVLMRAEKDFRNSPDVKKDLVLNTFTADQLRFAVAIDDREDVCTMYKSIGITALQIHRRPNV